MKEASEECAVLYELQEMAVSVLTLIQERLRALKENEQPAELSHGPDRHK